MENGFFPFRARPIFRCELLVEGRILTHDQLDYHDNLEYHLVVPNPTNDHLDYHITRSKWVTNHLDLFLGDCFTDCTMVNHHRSPPFWDHSFWNFFQASNMFLFKGDIDALICFVLND